MTAGRTNKEKSHSEQVRNYYKFHSYVYDISRWTFLFGRNKILKMIPPLPPQARILEIGCGTGRNLRRLQNQYPDAQITGVDLSSDMLKVAKKRVKGTKQIRLINADFLSDDLELKSFDLILLSYSLTMFGQQADSILERISQNLKPGGYVAVVDFNTSPAEWFRKWMNLNHVDFSGTFLPLLQQKFDVVETEVNEVYLGLWNYFLFVGRQL